MEDRIEFLGDSKIQHGKLSNRIYLMDLSKKDMPSIIRRLDKLASKNSYSKIFAKIPKRFEKPFTDSGYVVEAAVPELIGDETGLFISKFLDKKRSIANMQLIDKVISTAKKKQKISPSDGHIEFCNKDDAEEMAKVYSEVFESYPFPIFDPDYLRKTMDGNVVYFRIRNKNIVALSSAEIYGKQGCVEMTDFATLSGSRKKGLASQLLKSMETEMKKRGLKTSYTIARALSFGMNITFAKQGYKYAGTLINNTNIAGNLESMNVWYKHL